MTKFLFLSLLLSLLCTQSLCAQKSRYAVEVGAFAEGVDLSYFRKLNYTVYESVDVNTIFRYYIDVQDEAEGARIREEARNAGHKYARVVDFEQIAAQCANQCGYQPRTATRSGNPSTMKVTTPSVASSTTKNNPSRKNRQTSLTTDQVDPSNPTQPRTPERDQTDPTKQRTPKDSNPTIVDKPQRTPSEKTTKTTTTTTTDPQPAPKKYKTVYDKEAGKYIRVPQN